MKTGLEEPPHFLDKVVVGCFVIRTVVELIAIIDISTLSEAHSGIGGEETKSSEALSVHDM